jgi:predicted ATPase
VTDSTFLTRVVLQNYKSIAACDVRLGPLTFLVGPNGSGKSNFLDALRFVADALRNSLDHAMRDRGGINQVRRRSSGHPTHFGVRLEFRLPRRPPDEEGTPLGLSELVSGARGHYSFRIKARSQGGYEVQQEQCFFYTRDERAPAAHFSVKDGQASMGFRRGPPPVPPAVSRDRLYLVTLSGSPEFGAVFNALSRMGFYNVNPDEIRDPQPPDPAEVLARDGWNVSSVLARLERNDLKAKERIEEYLASLVPGLDSVRVSPLGSRETVEFRQQVAGSKDPSWFPAASMSDGTLRALGILVALFQSGSQGQIVPLVGIEEPEAALHPGAAGVLRDILREASDTKQVVVTSHSADLLDDDRLDPGSVLAVMAENGTTRIGPLDEADRSVLRDRLYTVGELLRVTQLRPESPANGQDAAAAHLFERLPRRARSDSPAWSRVKVTSEHSRSWCGG